MAIRRTTLGRWFIGWYMLLIARAANAKTRTNNEDSTREIEHTVHVVKCFTTLLEPIGRFVAPRCTLPLKRRYIVAPLGIRRIGVIAVITRAYYT